MKESRGHCTWMTGVTLGQHKQDTLTGAPAVCFALLAQTAHRHGAQLMTLPAEPYRGSGSYCPELAPPPQDGLEG